MKLGEVAVANMLDGYEDQVIELVEELRDDENYQVPARATTMVLGFLRDIEDMARRGWITQKVAAEIAEDLEDWFQMFVDRWEDEDEDEDEEEGA